MGAGLRTIRGRRWWSRTHEVRPHPRSPRPVPLSHANACVRVQRSTRRRLRAVDGRNPRCAQPLSAKVRRRARRAGRVVWAMQLPVLSGSHGRRERWSRALLLLKQARESKWQLGTTRAANTTQDTAPRATVHEDRWRLLASPPATGTAGIEECASSHTSNYSSSPQRSTSHRGGRRHLAGHPRSAERV